MQTKKHMSEFESNRKRIEKIEQRNNVRKEKLASFFYDLAKLIFAALVLGGLSPLLTNSDTIINLPIFIFGLIATCSLAFFANQILKYK
ncbi:MAG: hypothetical protein ACI4UO_05210 [Paludibacteraceae bacterium]